ncbi:MAG: hypothetical protein LBR51_01565 [Bacteroidales bacterium]|jgi:capsular polysaccharide biosynthesis protein|nr:hypothetical protein [Bacteroidales bacterium]
MEDNVYQSFSLMRQVWKWKKFLLIIGVVTAVLTFVVTLFIPPKFKSTAIIYAPRTNALSKILLNTNNTNERMDIKAYAVEEETEQMMQILRSREILDALAQEFNLATYYGYGPDEPYRQSKLYKALKNNITVKRTEYGAISITVSDWDPEVAAKIANRILDLLDTVKNRIEHERAAAAYQILCHQLELVNREVKNVDDSLAKVMQYGVGDYERQSDRLMQQYSIAVAQGNTLAMQRLEKEMNKFAKYGPSTEALRDLQYYFREYQSLCKSKMIDARTDMESRIPTKFVVERAVAADRKFYPKKMTITLASTSGMLIFAVMFLLFVEKLKQVRMPQADNSRAGKE